MSAETAREVEARIYFERVHLGFGWMGEEEDNEEWGQLAVLDVRS